MIHRLSNYIRNSFHYLYQQFTWRNFFVLIFGIFAAIAVVAYFCDAFMEAQLSFPGLGLGGPALLAVTAVGAFFVAACYFLQEGFSLIGIGKYIVDKMPTDLVNAYSKLRGFSELNSADPDAVAGSPTNTPVRVMKAAPPGLTLASPRRRDSNAGVVVAEVPLTWWQRRKQNLALVSGSTIALGTALFWSITAFFGVLSIASTIGLSLSSPYLILAAVIIAVAQGSASLAQEGVNANVKLGSKPKPFLVRCVRRLARWINPKAIERKRMDATKSPEGTSSDDDSVATDTASLRKSSSTVVKATGWRRYIPSRRTAVKLMGYFFVLAALLGHGSDFFMEAQFVFATLGMSSGVGLGILCAAVVVAVCIAFYFQDGISLRDGWFSIMEWMSFKRETPAVAKPMNPSKRIFLGFGSVSVSFVVVAVNGMTAFFGVIAVGLAFAGIGGAPWIVALAVLAAIAQGSCSASQECANLVKVATGCKTDDKETDEDDGLSVASSVSFHGLDAAPAPAPAPAAPTPVAKASVDPAEVRRAVLLAIAERGLHAAAKAAPLAAANLDTTVADKAVLMAAY